MAETRIRFKGDASDLKNEIDSVNAEADGMESSFSGAAAKAGPAIGAAFLAVGAVAGAAFLDGVGQEASGDRIAGSLLLDEGETEKFAEIAGASYANGFGESVQDQQEVVRSAIRGGLIDLNDMTAEEATSIADRLSGIADMTGMGAEEITQAAGSAIRSGLADDVDEAVDLLASLGPSVNFDEAIAATQEYSPFLEDLGLDAENWAGAMTSSSQTSMQSIDKTGDALKEMGVIFDEESDDARSAMEDMGLDADDMFKRINEGDPTAVHDLVDALDDIEDPAERARAGVALMGTPFEDLGDNAIPILQDLDTEVGSLADSEAVVSGAYDNLEGSFTSNWRSIKQSVTEAITETIMPVANGLMEFFIEDVPEVLESLQEWWNEIFGAIGTDTEGIFTTIQETIGEILEAVRERIEVVLEIIMEIWDEHGEEIMDFVSETFTSIWEIISGLLEIIREVIKVGTDAIEWIWENHGDKIMRIIEFVFDIISNVISTVMGVIKGIIDTVMGVITGDWDRAWNGIKGIFSSVWDGIKGIFETSLGLIWDIISTVGESILDWFRELPGKIGGFFSNLADTITGPFRSAFGAIKSLWNNTAGGFGFSTPSWIPGIGGKSFRIPNMHLGGVFDALTPGGEGLHMLRDGERVLSPLESQAYDMGMGSHGGDGGWPETIQLVLDSKVIAEVTRKELVKTQRRNGTTGLV